MSLYIGFPFHLLSNPEAISSHASSDSNDRPSHVREGAFEPSALPTPPPEFVSPSGLVGAPIETVADADSTAPSSLPALAMIVVEPADDLHDHDEAISLPPSQKSWISLSQALLDGPPSSRSSSDEARPSPSSHSLLLVKSRKEGSKDDIRQSLSAVTKGTLTNLKRFSSLPRTPSISSKAPSVPRSSVSPSPPIALSPLPSPSPSPVLRPSRPKIRSNWPESMWCRDVVTLPTALDRAMGYAYKINDLAKYDCGLGDWVVAAKLKGQGIFCIVLTHL